MRCEIPAPRRCCFCVPLRIGLLIAGYIKLVLSFLSTIYVFTTFYDFIHVMVVNEHVIFLIVIIISLLNCVVDVVFHITFIIGAHRKNHRLIRMYNRYSIYNIIVIIAIFVFNMAVFMNIFIFIFLFKYVVFFILTFIWTILVQLYLMILVRSEVLKLKNNTQFQFVNNQAEAECSATIQLSQNLDEEEGKEEQPIDIKTLE